MNTFLLEIITPDKLAYTDTVNMVTVPSATGEIGVLAHHVPLFSRLVEGEVKITKGTEEFFLAIGGGYLEVTKDRISILVSRAVHAKELNEAEILKAQQKAKDDIKSGVKGDQLREAQTLMRRTLLDMKLLKRRHSSTIH
jgi:F-type H+-transporting ATPase subunit epsilon